MKRLRQRLKAVLHNSDFHADEEQSTNFHRRSFLKEDIIHENGAVPEYPTRQYGSDGESENRSGGSEEVVAVGSAKDNTLVEQEQVVVRRRPKTIRTNNESEEGGGSGLNHGRKRLDAQYISKRLSLPAEFNVPESVLARLAGPESPLDGPLTRKLRRTSLSELGFGKLETYIKLEKLGEGTYADVYKGKSRLTDTLVALKEIRLEHDEGAPCTAIREVSLLRDLRHANIVTLHDIIHNDKSLVLVFEYLERDLKSYMTYYSNDLNMNNVRIFLFQLLRGLNYCHRRRVLHRDLKPQNLLINQRGELKLADFGLARAKSVPTKTFSNEVVTLWYRPPDIILGSTDYSTHIDIWGVGCIFYEMATCRAMFPGASADEQVKLIFKMLGTPNEAEWSGIESLLESKMPDLPFFEPEPLINRVPRLDLDGLELLTRFLCYNVKQRVTAGDAMKHPYFNVLGPNVHRLNDIESIFSLPEIVLEPETWESEELFAARGLHLKARSGKPRRQSMLL